MGKKMIVTGGAGFIGSCIVDALVEKGHEVHVIDTFVAGRYEERINKRATYHNVDIRGRAKLEPIISDASGLFHTAALPRVQFSIDHPEDSHDVNVNGTLAVLLASKNARVKRVIYSASSSAYGDQPSLPLTEDMMPDPKSPYALQKYIGEQYCRVFSSVFGLSTVCLRYFNVYGPRFDPEGPYAQALGKFLKQKKEGKPLTIWGDGTHTRDFVHISDVARANLLALDSTNVGKGEAINIGTGREISVSEIANMVGGPVVHEAERLEIARTRANNNLAKQLLGWEPTIRFEDGIADLKKQMNL